MEEHQIIDQPETTQDTVAEQPVVAHKESSIERNLAAMRKKLEAEEAARREAERRAEEAYRLMQEKERGIIASVDTVADEEDSVDPDDYLQGKTFQKATKKLKTKQQEQERKVQELNEKLAYLEAKAEVAAIKDFYEVLTDDNVKTLARLYPEDYATVMSNPNLTAKSKTLYNMVKNYGIVDPVQQKTQERIDRNKTKPISASSTPTQTPQTPLTRLGDYERRVLTESDRNRILAELNRKKMQG